MLGRRQPRTRCGRGLEIASRLLVLAGVALTVLALAVALYLAGSRGVGDAKLQALRIMAVHHESDRYLPIPPKLAAAVVSVEDEQFYDSVALDVITGAGRAALAAFQTGEDPGGSTIDQQLAEQLYREDRGFARTLRGIGLGFKLGLTYSKRQILQMYLNVVYYGHGFWGVAQASEGYFHTPPNDLSWAEAAMLAGLLQAPNAYDPLRNLALARQRQRHVLAQLVANGYITPSGARSAYSAPLPLAGH